MERCLSRLSSGSTSPVTPRTRLLHLGQARSARKGGLCETTRRASSDARRGRAGGLGRIGRNAPSRFRRSGDAARLVRLRVVHDHGERAGLPALGDAEMAGQRPHKRPRELPARPARWTDSGSGSSQVTQGDQTRDIEVRAAAGKFQFSARALDHKLVIGQANAQLRVPNGIIRARSRSRSEACPDARPGRAGGVRDPTAADRRRPDQPHRLRLDAADAGERVLRAFSAGRRSVTKTCSWRFAKAGTSQVS